MMELQLNKQQPTCLQMVSVYLASSSAFLSALSHATKQLSAGGLAAYSKMVRTFNG